MGLIKRTRIFLAVLILSGCVPEGVAPQERDTAAAHPAQRHVEDALRPAAPRNLAGARELSSAFRAAAAEVLPAVVYITVDKTPEQRVAARVPDPFGRFFGAPDEPREAPPIRGAGSGFVVNESGLILTNNHVVAGATRIGVRLLDGQEVDATLVGGDANTDVALIRIDPPEGETLPVAPLGEADSLLVGDWVLALGNPLGLDFSVTAGIVSAKGRSLSGNPSALQSYIQTDAAINPGNSGGPLVDLEGHVVGINSAIFGGGDRFIGYGLAVPIDIARRVEGDLLEFGFVRRPRLGIGVTDVTAVDAEAYGLSDVAGAEVNTVEEDSPAADAGLQPGDVIIALDTETIGRANELTTRLAERHPRDRVHLTVVREGREREVQVTLGEFPHEVEEIGTERPAATSNRVLGFAIAPLTPQLSERLGYRGPGVVVRDVERFGPAAAAGVRPGQIIESVNRQRVSSPEDLRKMVEQIEPGDVVSLRVVDPQVGETMINYRSRR